MTIRKKMKIAYIGFDALFEAMEAFLEEGCEILEVFTCRTDNQTEFNVRLTEKARELGVPCHLERIREADIQRLIEKGCDAIFCAGYYYKIPIVEGIPMLNFHPSYLPMGRGAWPMPVMILRQMKEGGVTLHKLTQEMDAGDILLQSRFPLQERENLETITEKIQLHTKKLIHTLLTDFEGIYAAAKPQGEGEYWDCPGERDWTVTPEMADERIDRILRAFFGYECIWKDGERRFELIRGRLTKERPEEEIFFETKEESYVTAEKVTELKN